MLSSDCQRRGAVVFLTEIVHPVAVFGVFLVFSFVAGAAVDAAHIIAFSGGMVSVGSDASVGSTVLLHPDAGLVVSVEFSASASAAVEATGVTFFARRGRGVSLLSRHGVTGANISVFMQPLAVDVSLIVLSVGASASVGAALVIGWARRRRGAGGLADLDGTD